MKDRILFWIDVGLLQFGIAKMLQEKLDAEEKKKKTNEYKIVHDITTFKRCDGFTKLYQNGFILPLWQDFIIETTKEGGYRWSVPEDIREEHGGGTIDHHDNLYTQTR